MTKEIIIGLEERMKKSISNLQREFAAIRTGRANVTMFDKINIDVYGTMMPLNQVATISIPEPRLVVIQPWDKGNLASIEKAILKSDLSLNPTNDGNLVRIQIPDLTEERRKEYVKMAKNKSEESKVAIRNIRRDGNELVKKAEKDKTVSEDEAKTSLDEIQKLTDKFIEEIQKFTDNKEKEILNL